MSPHSRCGRRGFTLVELLVVITIIGVLVSLLLPAVNSTREVARRTSCSNNLHQFGIAAQRHMEKWNIFPTGGWGWYWVGDPDRGFDRRQPGGWTFGMLPYLDQVDLHDLGKGMTDENAKRQAINRVVRTPLAVFTCPSRRKTMKYPKPSGGTYIAVNAADNNSADNTIARSDYAANSGNQQFNEYFSGPGTLAEGDNPSYSGWHDTTRCTGVSFERSQITMAHVRDGASLTFLIGEKYINPDHYASGGDPGDNEGMYTGFNNDNFRVTYFDKATPANSYTPKQDRRGAGSTLRFGSAHPSGVNFVFCDGNVRLISYNIDPRTYSLLGCRNDDATIDPAKL